MKEKRKEDMKSVIRPLLSSSLDEEKGKPRWNTNIELRDC